MSSVNVPNGIVFFGYKQSPYARRVQWYLTLRQIPYAQCTQPPILPRPDLNALGIHYRRIPALAIGRNVYIDSRAIIRRLDELFPPSAQHPGLSSPQTAGMAALLNKFVVDPSGVFVRAVQMIPASFGLMKDEAFLKDRAGFFGGKATMGDIVAQRPDALVHMRQCFEILESLLQDGREWIANTEELSIADLEGEWAFDWLLTDLQPEKEYFNEQTYPKTFAWIARFRKQLQAARARAPKPILLQGPEAVRFVTSARFSDAQVAVDSDDPLHLQAGTVVEVFPTDGGGNTHKDKGKLVKLTTKEVAIAVRAETGEEVRLHAPRWNFKIRMVDGSGSKL